MVRKKNLNSFLIITFNRLLLYCNNGFYFNFLKLDQGFFLLLLRYIVISIVLTLKGRWFRIRNVKDGHLSDCWMNDMCVRVGAMFERWKKNCLIGFFLHQVNSMNERVECQLVCMSYDVISLVHITLLGRRWWWWWVIKHPSTYLR